ncbi:MAG: hypothetical protein JXR76_27070 [Deltaproteobacteria bacterium]|nr:hypothetical protein [Deltaproteobacteria bacterium]
MKKAPLGFVRRQLLNEMLNLPRLVQRVQALPVPYFHDIIQKIGLEDCGELVAMATPSQLESLFDADLWKNAAPGEKEQFDSNRFVTWLEILLEAGEDIAQEKVSEMDEELLMFALSSQLFVLSSEELNRFFEPGDDEAHQVDTLLESCLYEELFEYQIISRNPETWDTLLTILVDMDKSNHEMLCRILNSLAQLGSQEAEDEGLYSVLSEIESMGESVEDKRDSRRGKQGYVSSLDARSFLGLANRMSVEELLNPDSRDAITLAYFRTYRHPDNEQNSESSELISEVLELLNDSSNDKTPSASVAGHLWGDVADNQTMLLLALQKLQLVSASLYQRRMSELMYLGNLVAAGCSLQNKQMRNVDASSAVTATCALGLEFALTQQGKSFAMDAIKDAIQDISMEKLFLLGWKQLNGSDTNRSFPYRAFDSGVYSFYDSARQLLSM